MKSTMATKEERNKFSMMIMRMAMERNIDHMDAITTYCEKTNLEVELAATLVNETLKDIIQSEAAELRYLPKSGKLPI